MKLFVLFLSFAFSNAHAKIEVRDLGVKLDLAGTTLEAFRPEVTRSVVGHCEGQMLTDYASLEGCTKMSQAKKMTLTPEHSTMIGAISTSDISTLPKLNLPTPNKFLKNIFWR